MVVFSLTLIRHGETLANRKNIIQGQSDVPLSDVGIQQAKLVGIRLQHERLTHVFASDLLRAAKTAEAIVEANKVYDHSVIKDKRLRERKFGDVEGKTFKELAAEAKRHNTTIPNFIPIGAERIEQVRARARSFFHDLITLLKNTYTEDGNYIPGSIKRRADYNRNVNSEPIETSHVAGSLIPNIGNGTKRLRQEDLSLPISTNGFCSKKKPDILDGDKVFEEFSSVMIPTLTSMTRSHSGSSGCSSLLQNGSDDRWSELSTPTAQDKDLTPRNVHFTNCPSPDKQIRTVIQQPRSADSFGCPNVSLSPLLDHRLTSFSSVSSGRSGSFDDADLILPPCTADVLVVSHGGFLKELLRHFAEDLKCKMPGGKGYALRVGPNCSVSKFTITIDDATERPAITCLLVHDQEHLMSLDFGVAPGVM